MKTGLILCAGGTGCNVAAYFRNNSLPDVPGWQLDVLALDTPGHRIDKAGRNRLHSLSSVEHGAVDMNWLLKRIVAADRIILVGCMGGNAGRRLLPFLATMARACALPVSAILLLPFQFEGKKRYELTVLGNSVMQPLTDHVELLDNENILNFSAQVSLQEQFKQQFRHIGELCARLLCETEGKIASAKTTVGEAEHC